MSSLITSTNVTPAPGRPRNNSNTSIPDDPDHSTFRFVHLAAQRARQLHRGSRPMIPVISKKPIKIAMEECSRGLVAYDA